VSSPGRRGSAVTRRSIFLEKGGITGSRRGACHRAALCADPLAAARWWRWSVWRRRWWPPNILQRAGHDSRVCRGGAW